MYSSRRQAKKAQTQQTSPVRCDVAGCTNPGEHRAPKKRGGGGEYYMFCLQHVREFNKSYDYFSGMEEEAVQAFMKDAVTGHRPTWRMGQGPSLEDMRLDEHIERFFGDPACVQTQAQPLPPELREACELFDMTPPLSEEAIKRHYKVLVKRYHPDINKDANAEERFKQIVAAYQLLLQHCAL